MFPNNLKKNWTKLHLHMAGYEYVHVLLPYHAQELCISGDFMDEK